MSLKSLEKILEGVGKLRAASLVTAVVSAAAVLGLNLSAGVQEAALTGVTVLLAVVNIVDGYIRGQHVAALPALIAQGAESVATVHDPRVDVVATAVGTLADRLAALESAPKPPTLPEIITGLMGGTNPAPAVTVAPVAPETPPAA